VYTAGRTAAHKGGERVCGNADSVQASRRYA